MTKLVKVFMLSLYCIAVLFLVGCEKQDELVDTSTIDSEKSGPINPNDEPFSVVVSQTGIREVYPGNTMMSFRVNTLYTNGDESWSCGGEPGSSCDQLTVPWSAPQGIGISDEGYLVFSSQESYSVFRMSMNYALDNELDAWEEEIGFLSLRRSGAWFEKYPEYADIISYPYDDKRMSSMINTEGVVQIGDVLQRYTDNTYAEFNNGQWNVLQTIDFRKEMERIINSKSNRDEINLQDNTTVSIRSSCLDDESDTENGANEGGVSDDCETLINGLLA